MIVLSLKGKKWNVKIEDLSKPVVDKVYEVKGLHDDNRKSEFLHENPRELLHDPFLLHDMEKACVRIEQAIKDRERIIVFGDYDVDGVTATAVLVRTLKKLGAEVSYRIPHRIRDGYSLKEYFLEELCEKDVKLLITVDNGIAAASEISYANELGMDIIVTDHHTPPPVEQLPVAHAIINPQLESCPYPCKDLSGSAVALKLCVALCERNLGEAPYKEQFINTLYQIAGIGIVADCMQLVGENRAIVRIALEQIHQCPLPGVAHLLESAQAQLEHVTATSIGFVIGPRINAAGRLDSAYDALHLFLNQGEGVKEIAKKLDHMNRERRSITQEFTEEAKSLVNNEEPIIFVYSERWNSGINGLVASRLVEAYGKPVIVGSHDGESLVASCRSIQGFHMVDALRSQEALLSHFGGHAAAAGFSIDMKNLHAFKEGIFSYAKEQLNEDLLTPVLDVCCDILPGECSMETLERLAHLEPFGMGNEKPSFLYRGATLDNLKAIGKTHDHLSFSIGGVRGVAFGMGKYHDELKEGAWDVIMELDKNIWNGREYLQYMVKDVRKTG